MNEELSELFDRYQAMEPGEGARRVSAVYMLLPTEHGPGP